jgi:hypothetical protein
VVKGICGVLQLRRERVQFHVASTTQKNTAHGGACVVEPREIETYTRPEVDFPIFSG